jgi:N6-adenosine-specific RNA methylase IME4
MTQLALYEAARSALAECRSIDEVKDIHDKAEALRAYARMANDVQLEADAAELRLRAERRLGIMLSAEKDAGRLISGRPKTLKTKSDNGTPSEPLSRLTLDDIGVDKRLSARSQKVGGIAERAFEAMVVRKRAEIQRASGRVSLDLAKTEDKAERRKQRMAALAGAEGSLKAAGTFNVIYADPPWAFEPYSLDTGMDRAADNHYPTMTVDAIKAMDVPKIAARDCVLFLWATVPMLRDALDVMDAWGFEYKSHCIWNKDRIGTGYWFRNKHELLLVGVKGKIPAPLPGTQAHSVIDGPVKEHSKKPIIFKTIIKGLFPDLPGIELFARAGDDDWKTWGKESPAEHDADGVVIEPKTPEQKHNAELLDAHQLESEAEGSRIPAYLQR